jgi:hypothetical protein
LDIVVLDGDFDGPSIEGLSLERDPDILILHVVASSKPPPNMSPGFVDHSPQQLSRCIEPQILRRFLR